MNRLWLTFAGANQRQRADLSAALGLGKRPVTLRRSSSGVLVTGIGTTRGLAGMGAKRQLMGVDVCP